MTACTHWLVLIQESARVSWFTSVMISECRRLLTEKVFNRKQILQDNLRSVTRVFRSTGTSTLHSVRDLQHERRKYLINKNVPLNQLCIRVSVTLILHSFRCQWDIYSYRVSVEFPIRSMYVADLIVALCSLAYSSIQNLPNCHCRRPAGPLYIDTRLKREFLPRQVLKVFYQ